MRCRVYLLGMSVPEALHGRSSPAPLHACFPFCSAATSLRASRGLPVGPELVPALQSRPQTGGAARVLRRAANVVV